MSKKLTVSNVLLLYITVSVYMIFSGIQEICDVLFIQEKTIFNGFLAIIFGIILLLIFNKLYVENKNHKWYQDINKN